MHYIYMVFYVIRVECNWNLSNYNCVYYDRSKLEETNHINLYSDINHTKNIMHILDKIESGSNESIADECQYILERVCKHGCINNAPQLIDIIHYMSTPSLDIKAIMTSIVLLLD